MKWLLVFQVNSPVPGGLWTVFALLAVVGIEMLALRLIVGPQVAKHSDKLDGKEPGSFDFKISGYSPQQARAMVSAYGPEGRKWYLWGSVLSLDILLPLSYGLLYVSAALHSAEMLLGNAQWGWVVAALGIVMVIFDLLENLAVYKMLTHDPAAFPTWQGWDVWARAGSFFTRTKWVLFLIELLVLLPVFVISLINP